MPYIFIKSPLTFPAHPYFLWSFIQPTSSSTKFARWVRLHVDSWSSTVLIQPPSRSETCKKSVSTIRFTNMHIIAGSLPFWSRQLGQTESYRYRAAVCPQEQILFAWLGDMYAQEPFGSFNYSVTPREFSALNVDDIFSQNPSSWIKLLILRGFVVYDKNKTALVSDPRPAVGLSGRRKSTRAIRVTRINHSGSFLIIYVGCTHLKARQWHVIYTQNTSFTSRSSSFIPSR
jgi:hypothetical protein